MILKLDIVIIFSVMVELYRYAVHPQTHYQRSKIQCTVALTLLKRLDAGNEP